MTTTTDAIVNGFTTRTYGMNYLIEIANHDETVRVTASALQSGGAVREFGIWHGDAFDDQGEETPPAVIIRVDGDLATAWKRTVATAIRIATTL